MLYMVLGVYVRDVFRSPPLIRGFSFGSFRFFPDSAFEGPKKYTVIYHPLYVYTPLFSLNPSKSHLDSNFGGSSKLGQTNEVLGPFGVENLVFSTDRLGVSRGVWVGG